MGCNFEKGGRGGKGKKGKHINTKKHNKCYDRGSNVTQQKWGGGTQPQ